MNWHWRYALLCFVSFYTFGITNIVADAVQPSSPGEQRIAAAVDIGGGAGAAAATGTIKIAESGESGGGGGGTGGGGSLTKNGNMYPSVTDSIDKQQQPQQQHQVQPPVHQHLHLQQQQQQQQQQQHHQQHQHQHHQQHQMQAGGNLHQQHQPLGHQLPQQQQQHQHQHQQHGGHGNPGTAGTVTGHRDVIESRSSYAMLSQAMQQAVGHEFSTIAPDGTCLADDLECLGATHDRLGMEAIKSLHQQLDDDENGNIDLTESDDFLREELKYDSGYEKRHKTFHYNDDTQISVKELWEAWLRSEVHNWTVEQTSDWLSQSVQLPQYVEVFQKHKVSGETLPRLAVHNMHYVSTVLGIRDPIHKQKIALKAMDVVLFGPPRETGTRWKDYFLVILLLTAIIGCWYAYQQNKNDKKHLRRMAKEMEGLQRAENALTEMQKELEIARLEQENVVTEKQDLERRLKEAPSLSSSNSDLEVQQLKQEIEMLRAELSRAEVELVDHCWTPPAPLQSWLQFTYELESKHAQKKRLMAEKQLQAAREACEKLRRKRSSLVGAFVSTHGKSIDDVDRSIVEARNALSEVTNELQERIHRWKQIESLLGFNIVHNNGLAYLENILYVRNGSAKSSKNRISGSQDELDDDSVQGIFENHGRLCREDSSGSDDGDTVTFIVGASEASSPRTPITPIGQMGHPISALSSTNVHSHNSHHTLLSSVESVLEENPLTGATDSIFPLPRTKKPSYINHPMQPRAAPLPPPRRANSHQSFIITNPKRSQSADIVEPTSSAIVTSSTGNNTNNSVAGGVNDGHQQDIDSQSTDSSSFDDELKKRRRKLHFPFGRKSNKSKAS